MINSPATLLPLVKTPATLLQFGTLFANPLCSMMTTVDPLEVDVTALSRTINSFTLISAIRVPDCIPAPNTKFPTSKFVVLEFGTKIVLPLLKVALENVFTLIALKLVLVHT